MDDYDENSLFRILIVFIVRSLCCRVETHHGPGALSAVACPTELLSDGRTVLFSVVVSDPLDFGSVKKMLSRG